MAYSVFVVFGTHTGGYTNGTVGQTVVQMQNVTHAALTATIGTVAAAGPSGVGNATNATITYRPAGFDPTYAAWEIAAITNTADVTLTVSTNYPLDHPIFQVDNYLTNQLPASIAVGSGLTNAGVNFYASVDTNSHRLWITVNRVVTNALNLVVRYSLPASQPAPVVSSLSPASGAAGTTVSITGQNLTNATAVTFNGVAVTAFTINSATKISTTVPAGAATGPVNVTTPGGTASSGSNFTVTGTVSRLTIVPASLNLKAGTIQLQLAGSTGQTFWVENSTNLFKWTSISTNVLTGTTQTITINFSPNGPCQYWRAVGPE